MSKDKSHLPVKQASDHQVHNLFPALFDPFLSHKYTRVRVFHTPAAARTKYLTWRNNLDFTGHPMTHANPWFE